MTQTMTEINAEVSTIEFGGGPLSSMDNCISYYLQLSSLEMKTQMERARVCAEVQTKYGEQSVVEFLKEVEYNGFKLSKTHFYALAKVHKAFGELDGFEATNLTMTHLIHCSQSDDPQAWAETASAEAWSVSELLNAMTQAKALPVAENDPRTSTKHELMLSDEDRALIDKGAEVHGVTDPTKLVKLALENQFGGEGKLTVQVPISDKLVEDLSTLRSHLGEGVSDAEVVRVCIEQVARRIREKYNVE